ncbi:Protein SEMI-ROLLED LEAF 2, partial [Cucurbita argyrosperma subsp. sororia]
MDFGSLATLILHFSYSSDNNESMTLILAITNVFDAEPNDRQICKLCDYASKNPLRIPKITEHLEQRCYKDLRNENFGYVKVVICIYRKLLLMCKEQMPLFANSLIGISRTLLEQTRHDDVQILGCNILVDFIRSQTDNTYMFNLEGIIPKLCQLALEGESNEEAPHLRSAGLQALASMWFLENYVVDGQYSHSEAQYIEGQDKVENHSSSILDVDQKHLAMDATQIMEYRPSVGIGKLHFSALKEGNDEMTQNLSIYGILLSEPPEISSFMLGLSYKVGDAGPILDTLAVVLENIPNNNISARATISAIIRLQWRLFPDALFHQLLLAMAHPDLETRIGAHDIFSIVLMPSIKCPRMELNAIPQKTCFMKLTSLRLSSHQVSLLLASIWVQATSSDNTPANFEAMAHTYSIALLFTRSKTSSHMALVRCFQAGIFPSKHSCGSRSPAGGLPELTPIIKASLDNKMELHYLWRHHYSSSPLAKLAFPDYDEGMSPDVLTDDEAFLEPSGSQSNHKTSISISNLDILSVNQLLESVLETARQVASFPVSSAPVPYDQMKSQCEALITCKQQKMSVLS